VEHVELTGPELLLRPWREGDAADVLAALRDPETAQWNPVAPALDLGGARAWTVARADWSAGTHASFAVTDRATGALVGSVSLHRIQGDEASIGYWTVAAARGRGVATAAVRLVTDWAFGPLRLHRIELCHAVANVASCRVAERAGYPWEGTLRESHRYGDGRRHDEHVHGRLATDA
jgi:RimJ/RimL family protein N-acetyltransferase